MVLAEFVIGTGGQNEFMPGEVNFMRGCENFVMERNEKEKSNRFLKRLFGLFRIRVERGTDFLLQHPVFLKEVSHKSDVVDFAERLSIHNAFVLRRGFYGWRESYRIFFLRSMKRGPFPIRL